MAAILLKPLKNGTPFNHPNRNVFRIRTLTAEFNCFKLVPVVILHDPELAFSNEGLDFLGQGLVSIQFTTDSLKSKKKDCDVIKLKKIKRL